MRIFRNVVIAVLILVVELVAIRRIGLSGGSGALLIFITMAVLLVWGAKQDARASQLKLQNAVASFGFKPANRDEVDLPIYPLRGDGWVQTAACGELRGLKAWIFSYGIHLQQDPDPVFNIHQTVVAFCVDEANLPAFQIRPLRSISTFEKDWKAYDGEWEQSDDTICFPDAPVFHQHFELASSAEEGVRRYFNGKLLNTIAALNELGCWVKGYWTTVLFFTPNRIFQPEEMEAFARHSADVAYAIFSAGKRTTAATQSEKDEADGSNEERGPLLHR